MLTQLKGVGWATIASIGLHGALAWAVLRAPVGSWGDRLTEPDAISIEVVTPEQPEQPTPPEPRIEPPPEEQVPPDEVPAALSERPLGEPNPRPGSEDPSASTVQPDSVPSTIEVPEVNQEPQQREMTEEERRRVTALINPANAARSSFTVTGPGPSRTGPAAGLGTGDTGPSERDIEASLSAGLRRQAMAREYLSRTEPELHRQADGSYAYSGHRFTARIRPDGSVEFDDTPNVQTNGFSASGSWDLNDALMGANGQDTNFYERQWFMRHTEELRARLEAEHRREQMGSALRRLPGRLARIWGTTSRSYAARRRRIFSIWDEMAEDSTGERARRIVIGFIRETLPEGSENAYTEREIARLNASRESTEEFTPY